MARREHQWFFLAECPSCKVHVAWTATAETGDRYDETRVFYAIDCYCTEQPSVVVTWPMSLTTYVERLFEGHQDAESVKA